MATTTIITGPFVVGDRKATVFEFNLDSSYPTGGESLTTANLGFSTSVDLVLVENQGGYSFEYDYTNQKLIARYFDYDAVADGAAIQVPDTTNLSAVTTIRGIAVGR